MPHYNPTAEDKISKHFYKTPIKGLFYFEVPKFNDERGFFSQLLVIPEVRDVDGVDFSVQQVNFAHSKQNVVRGMHAEGWNKLVFVNSGEAFSAIADVRPDSNTYKQVLSFRLGFHHEEKIGNGLFISKGLANSVAVTTGPLNYIYLVDEVYENRSKKDEASISIFDPDLKIDWPIAKQDIILSERDKTAMSLKEFEQR